MNIYVCIKNLLYMNMDKVEILCNCNGIENILFI